MGKHDAGERTVLESKSKDDVKRGSTKIPTVVRRRQRKSVKPMPDDEVEKEGKKEIGVGVGGYFGKSSGEITDLKRKRKRRNDASIEKTGRSDNAEIGTAWEAKKVVANQAPEIEKLETPFCAMGSQKSPGQAPRRVFGRSVIL